MQLCEQTQPVPDPATLSLLSRINSACNIIDLALQHAHRPIVTSKFGPYSAVLLHLVTEVRPGIPVVWVDTGFNTRATQAHAARLSEMFNLDLRVYRPEPEWSGFVPDVDEPAHQEFTERVKIEPFGRALRELAPDAWITAVRGDQTDHRRSLDLFQTSGHGVLKVCPLLDWSQKDMDGYLSLQQLPAEHDYHDPVKAGPRRECGLHLKY